MERICYTFDILPGTEAEYEAAHANIWPEVVEAMHEAGIENYTLFRRGTHVIAYGECAVSVEATLESLSKSDADNRWRDAMSPMFGYAHDENGGLLLADQIWRLP